MVLVTLTATAWCSLTMHDSPDVQVQTTSGAPVMTDEDALLSMYPLNTLSVPQQTEQAWTDCEQRFTLLLVADRDLAAHNVSERTWHSALRRGSLCRLRDSLQFTVTWLDEVEVTSRLNIDSSDGARGMELSEIVWYGGRLLACDDRTGIIFHIYGGVAIPRHVVSEISGPMAGKGFKCEWAAVRHGSLYVGAIGRPFRSANGETISTNDQVAVLEPSGMIHLANWSDIYNGMLAAAQFAPNGYLTHEAALWDDATDRWLFAPRRGSSEPFDEKRDERQGSDLLLWHSSLHNSSRIKLVHVNEPREPSRGYSSIRMLPGCSDKFVALKTEEMDGRVASYISVLRTNGTVLMSDTFISTTKFEGLEIAI
eukprot:CAMPEP_0119336932 /NCGR_PEP_ID=MMETSP1333-20130426/92939_1 /TAXON_ID=418940 /ORGANISM="Scyphosphaera apsteinii, Strain RCC1455" /LENGTH=367 /DNA_ID=CAMNT_0007347869 /DNA_START=299 /DNA_END=1402 /DNA_ORIENTATION=-